MCVAINLISLTQYWGGGVIFANKSKRGTNLDSLVYKLSLLSTTISRKQHVLDDFNKQNRSIFLE